MSAAQRTVAALLSEGQRVLGGHGVTGEAAVLLAGVLGVDRAALLARDTSMPAIELAERYRDLLARRAAGEPVAQLLGYREFRGLTLRVTPAVLIPRPETELLVELALTRLPHDRPARIADLGTGSGAIALALAHARPDCTITATDVSTAALTVAADNAARLGVRNVQFIAGDWCTPLPACADYDLIVSNPPYLAADDPHLASGDLRFEPRLALVGGPDGLEPARRIVAAAPVCLAVGGWLLLEHGHDHDTPVRALFGPGWVDVATWRDLAGLPRVTSARWAGML